MEKIKKVLAGALMAVLLASLGGCFYPYRPYYGYDYRRYDRDWRYRDYDHDR